MSYSKERPFLATIKERLPLSGEKSKKKTQHIVIDLQDSGIVYEVGDCIGIYPHHDQEIVEKTLNILNASGDEFLHDKRSGHDYSLKDFLHHKVVITSINRKLVTAFAEKQSNESKKLSLLAYLEKENRDELKEYLEKPLWAFLSEHSEVDIPLQQLCDMLQPLLPRFYSIASSQKMHESEVHLTVAMLEYQHGEFEKKGVCTHYLCNLTQVAEAKVPIYIHKHRGFTLPENGDTPIIMIGPGTGIAPFRGFMQERIATGAKGPNWLFFGEWTEENEFYYGDFWRQLAAQGKLRLDLAFSRDQKHKIYVQHRMKEHAEDFYRWLQAGAVVYVCGDMQNMAKDVDRALHEIVQEQGHLDEKGAKDFMARLKKEGRYLRDVY